MAEPHPSESNLDSLEAQIVGYVLDALSEEEAIAFQKQLRQQPELVDQVEQAQALIHLLAEASPQSSAPATLRQRVQAIAAPIPRFRDRWRVSWRDGAIAALALLAIVLAVDNYGLQRKLMADGAIIESMHGSEIYLVALKPDPSAPVSGSVLIDMKERTAVLALQKLSPLPDGKFYYLWAVSEQQVVPCGVVTAEVSNQTLFDTIAIPAEDYELPGTILIVTVESSPTPTQPSETVVVTSAI